MTTRANRSFAAVPNAAANVRAFVDETLSGVDADTLATVELMVSELANNCVRHVGMRFDVTILRESGTIRCEVTDQGYGRPVRRDAQLHDISGRGLQIVDLLSRDWGVDPEGGTGKTVWFAVTDPPAGARPARDAGHRLGEAVNRRHSPADQRRTALDRARSHVPGRADSARDDAGQRLGDADRLGAALDLEGLDEAQLQTS